MKVLFAVVLFTGLAQAQLWSGFINSSRAADWSTAGVVGGIPSASWANCTTAACNTLFGGSVTTTTIQNALGSASANTVVRIPAGSFSIATCISFTQSNVVLRGAGADQTKLVAASNIGCSGGGLGGTNNPVIHIMSGATGTGHFGGITTANWTGTGGVGGSYPQSGTVLTLSSTTGLVAGPVGTGSMIFLDQDDDVSDGWPSAGDVFACTSSVNNCSNQGGNNYARAGRSVVLAATVTNIAGLQVTIDHPIVYANWRTSQSPGAYWSTASTVPIHNSGMEDLTVDFTAGNQQGLYIMNAANVWVRGVRFVNTASGTQETYHVFLFQSEHVTVTDSYVFGRPTTVSPFPLANYPISTQEVSYTVLQNNIIQDNTEAIVPNDPGGVNVWAYNMCQDDNVGVAGTQYHSGTIMYDLWEGNNCQTLMGDVTHGTHFFLTAYRNHFDGTLHNNSGTTGFAMGFLTNNRFMNLLGNVCGATAYGQYETTLAGGSSAACFDLGWNGNNSGAVVTTDTNVKRTLLRWGNWDLFTSTNRTGTNDQTGTRFVTSEVPSGITNFPSAIPACNTTSCLPASFYLSSKPSWFGTIAFPAIGPDVTLGNATNTTANPTGGHANKIPSRVCFESLANDPNYTGNVKIFNSATCYAAVVPSPVPSCSPAGGSFKSGRLVSCTNAVPTATTCWRIGSPPTTDGNGTCTAGTTYTAPFMVSATSTLFVKGTQAGNTDSSVTYSFTINPAPWTAGWVLNSAATGRTTIGNTACTPPNYCAYSGVDIKTLPATPAMGGVIKSGLLWSDPTLPSSKPSRVARCTDQNSDPGTTVANQSKSAGLGGSGDAEQLWNTDSTFLHLNSSGGAHRIFPFDPVAMVCSPDITSNLNDTSPGSPSVGYAFGAGTFDWTDNGAGAGNTIYWGAGSGNDATVTSVAKYVINKTTHHFTVTTPYLDFNPSGLPITTLNAPAWQAGHAYSTGDYVSVTITGLGDWNGATAYIAGDLIQPLTNNPANCVFKVSVVGSRGTQPTSWSTGSTCTPVQTKTEVGGTESWRNLGNTGIFVFQLTSAGGTSGVGTPTWATVPTSGQSVHPDMTHTVTDNGLTWTNTGVLIPPQWTSFGGISKDSNRFCAGYSSSSYGHGAGSYNLDNADQGTGVFAGCYDFALNRFSVLNTLTGIQSITSCSGGTGYNCTGGTFTKLTAVGPAYATFATCNFMVHNLKGFSTLDYAAVSEQAPNPRIGFVGTCQGQILDWLPFAPYASTNAQLYNFQSNHYANGHKAIVNVGDASAPGTGTYTSILQSDNPTAASQTSWQVNPCDGAWAVGSVNPPCGFGAVYDSHLAFLHGPLDNDTGPVCGTFYDANTGHANPVAPYANELLCISTSPNWDPSVGPIGSFHVWRFTHNFNMLSNPFFDTQFGISQLSQDGKFIAFSSDWNCTLGDLIGNPTNTCGTLWTKNTVYTIGTNLNPFSGLSGSGTNFGVWQVITNGTSAASAPTWTTGGANNCVANTIVTDANAMQYKCLGPNNAKGEVFVVELK